jgi:CRISPR-associated endonuclease/helicase Cas3
LRIAEEIASNLPFEDTQSASIIADLQEAIAVHDVGKAAVGFQKSLKSTPWGKRHEVISASFASFQKLKDEVIFAVLTHHKTIPSDGILACKGCLNFEEIPLPLESYAAWLKMAKEWEENKSLFAVEWAEILSKVKSNNLKTDLELSPLTLSKAWLDSWQQTKKISFDKRVYASLLRGLLMSCDHVASSGIDINIPKIPLLANINHGIQSLYGFQKRASLTFGNLILQAPTGSGKTLAALLWAGKNQKRNGRLFYCLPNTASINAMYLRLSNNYYGKENVGLLHSRALTSLYSLWEDDYNSPILRQRNVLLAKSLAKEIWYPIRVCTPHQILRYMLRGKGWELMLSEFPNSCFVFDEIHAYDPVITGFIVATAKFLAEYNASCIFLSATLPDFIKKILEDALSPINFVAPANDDPSDRAIIEKKRQNLQIVDGNMLVNIERVINAINNDARSTLIVCNHVPSAQIVFEELSKRGVNDVILLHSRFCRRDRDAIENVIQERLPKVLVATQVVEVSLDVDFDQAFLEPAPIDALIQRLGRVNRKGERPPAAVFVFTDQLGKYPVYDKYIVARSLVELQNLSNPLREMDLIDVANRVYGKGYEGENLERYNNALNHPLIKGFKEKLIAGLHYDWTKEVIEQTDGTLDLLPRCLLSQYEAYQSQGLWIESNRLLVPVRVTSLSYLSQYLDKSHDPWVINKPYSASLGLSLKTEGQLE